MPGSNGGFKVWGDAAAPIPEKYDLPVCWLPQSVDNSSGGQLWVTSDRWGPLKDQLLFMSYGKCSLFLVMPDSSYGVRQAAMVQFPLRFFSGIMRGRVNPTDGQVYLCGLKGWQTSAVKEGGFYRVRYTGKPVRMPIGFHASKEGIEISFATKLDPTSAAYPGNYSVEMWNYRWTGAYGSPEFSVKEHDKQGHDVVTVGSVTVGHDGKSVLLKTEGLKPADQVRVKFSVAMEGGTPTTQEIYATVYQL